MMDLSKLNHNIWNATQSTAGEPQPQNSGGSSSTTSTGGEYTNWGQMPGSYKPFEGDSKYGYITQDWYRNPDWMGGAIWNPTFGWQEVNQVKNKYGGQAATDEQFNNWDLNRNLSGSWEDYVDQLGYTNDELGGGGTGDAYEGQSMFDFGRWRDHRGGGRNGYEDPFMRGADTHVYDPNMDPTSWIGAGNVTNPGGTWDGSQFGAQPSQWNTASNVLQDMANTGGYVPAPDEWYGASYGANQMAQGGMPTDVDPWYQKAKEVSDYDTQEAIKQAMEQSGLTGNRWSSGAQRTAADIGGKYASQLGANYAQQTMAAQEAARGRQQGAYDQLFNIGSGFAGLDTAARQRQLESTGQLGGLGQYMTQYPMQLANQASQIGAGQTALEQSALDKAMQEWMRTQPEYSPYLNMAYGMATGQGMQQQFTPGAGSQWMSGLSSLLPFLFL